MTKRLLSVDIFRGFTIFMMVFVNDVASVSGIPEWLKHAGTYDDRMTFVDVVFPAFLFIVGMAIPLAVRNRLSKGQSWSGIWQHALVRTIGLLVLGVYMVNADEMNNEANLLPAGMWKVLLYISAILIWNAYPKDVSPSKRNLFRGLQGIGIVVLLLLAFTFRKGEAPELTGMTPSWWGILGLIGWAYLYSMVIYFFLRTNLVAVAGVIGLLTVTVLGLQYGETEWPSAIGWLKGQAGNFSHTLITLSGTLFSIMLLEVYAKRPLSHRIHLMIGFGLLALLAGFFIRTIGGISKNLATPTWSLYSVAICCGVFALLYWLVDVKGWKSWFRFLQPAGANPLLTYILPFIFYALGGFAFLPEVLKQGGPGVIRSIIFSLLILGLAQVLTRLGIRLKL